MSAWNLRMKPDMEIRALQVLLVKRKLYWLGRALNPRLVRRPCEEARVVSSSQELEVAGRILP